MITENPFRNFEFDLNQIENPLETAYYIRVLHLDFPFFRLEYKGEFSNKYLNMQDKGYLSDSIAKTFKSVVNDLLEMLIQGKSDLLDEDGKLIQSIAYDQEKQKWFGLNPETKEIIYEKN